MIDQNRIREASKAEISRKSSPKKPKTPKSFFDYLSLTVTTFGVGYLPLAPGTWGSIVGVLIYLLIIYIEGLIAVSFLAQDWLLSTVTAWFYSINLLLFLLFCLLGIRTSGRATKLFRDKDPQKVVVDEVMGQLLVFLFVPFLTSWWLIFAGFLLFRVFDIIKPYPIDYLQTLPAGLGVCADDLLAGVYGGVCLSILYAMSLSF